MLKTNHFSIFDLPVHSPKCEPVGLAALVRQILKLSERQIVYAADDSLSALQTFVVFMDELGKQWTGKVVQKISILSIRKQKGSKR